MNTYQSRGQTQLHPTAGDIDFEPPERFYSLVDRDRSILKVKAMTPDEANKRNENVKELGYTWVSGGYAGR